MNKETQYKAALSGVRSLVGPFAHSGWLPFGVHRHEPRVYVAAYVIIQDLYLAEARVLSRAEREIVAMAISSSNQCQYCTNSHAALVRIDALNVQAAIREGRVDAIKSPRQRALAQYGMALRYRKQAARLGAAFTPLERADIANLVITFHYLNRVMDALGPTGMALRIASNPPSTILAWVLRYRRGGPRGGGACPTQYGWGHSIVVYRRRRPSEYGGGHTG